MMVLVKPSAVLLTIGIYPMNSSVTIIFPFCSLTNLTPSDICSMPEMSFVSSASIENATELFASRTMSSRKRDPQISIIVFCVVAEIHSAVTRQNGPRQNGPDITAPVKTAPDKLLTFFNKKINFVCILSFRQFFHP